MHFCLQAFHYRIASFWTVSRGFIGYFKKFCFYFCNFSFITNWEDKMWKCSSSLGWVFRGFPPKTVASRNLTEWSYWLDSIDRFCGRPCLVWILQDWKYWYHKCTLNIDFIQLTIVADCNAMPVSFWEFTLETNIENSRCILTETLRKMKREMMNTSELHNLSV